MVAKMTRMLYHVDAYQDGKWWSLQVREMPNAISQVKSLDQADEWIREAINIVSDEPEDSFDVEIIPVVGEELEAALAEAREFSAELDQFQRRMVRMYRSVMLDLSKLGTKGKNIAAILKVSPQRVSQLLKGHK
jgi:predicted RNase H-like HicB family nuclease